MKTATVRPAPGRAIASPRKRTMKPGMQRDILVAFWFLFDEFEIGEDDPQPVQPDRATAAVSASEPEKPKRNNGGKNRRPS